MTQLSDFSAEEAELLVSLPYKVGVFISHADDVDGERDDQREIKALESCIRAVGRLHEDKPFTSEVAKAALEQKDKWPSWIDASFHAPEEARKAVAVLRGKAPEQVRKNYRAFLMEVASTVAQAHGEFSSFDEEQPEGGLFGGLVGRIAGSFKGLSEDDAGHPMNVSAAEDTAISLLAKALKDD